jgi:hypothetical protein
MPFAALLLTRSASATPPQQIAIEARAGWTILGTTNPTGGFTPQIAATYLWAPSDTVRLGLGVDLGAFGFGGAARWIGVLGGPTARIAVKPWSKPLSLSLTLSAGFGRAPVCTPWPDPICPRFVGSFPAATLSGMWTAQSGLTIGASFATRLANTLIGTSVGFEPALVVGGILARK